MLQISVTGLHARSRDGRAHVVPSAGSSHLAGTAARKEGGPPRSPASRRAFDKRFAPEVEARSILRVAISSEDFLLVQAADREPFPLPFERASLALLIDRETCTELAENELGLE